MSNHTSATFRPTSNRTTQATDKELILPTWDTFTLFRFPWKILGFLAAKTVSGEFKLEAIPRILPKMDLMKKPDELEKTNELTHNATSSIKPLSRKLIQGSRNRAFPKYALQHKRHAEDPTKLEKEIIENLAHIMASTATNYDSTWHPSDIWLMTLTIVNVFLGLLGLIYQHQAFFAKKPLTKGRDMKQDFHI